MTFPTRARLAAVAVSAALVGAAAATVIAPRVHAAQLASPERVRFRLAGDEPIATPDGRSLINNWKVVVLRDTKSDQCYTLFLSGASMSATGPATCLN